MSGLWYEETFNQRMRYALRVTRSLFSGRSDHQVVEIVDTAEFGITLIIDGYYMTSVGDEFLYHEMLVHPALTTAPAIGRVLVVGGGDGGTVREVLRHPEVAKVTMVEIDALVVEACKEHLPPGFGAWDDPRLELIIGDGIQYVADAPADSFDVVLLDGTDPVGPATGLFDECFYRNVRRILRPDGVFALQSESPIYQESVFLDIQRTLRRVFGDVRPYFGPVPIYAAGVWSWTYASTGVDPFAIDAARAARVEAVTRQYNRDVHRGAFALPNRFRAELGRAAG